MKRSDHDQTVLDSLLAIFRFDKLFHVDLSEVGLTSDIILKLIKPIKDNLSLIGLHLSGNPGLTGDMEKRLVVRLNATYEKRLQLDSFQ